MASLLPRRVPISHRLWTSGWKRIRTNSRRTSTRVRSRLMRQATDSGFQIKASNCRFGSGITHEVGMDLVDLGAKRVLLVINPAVRRVATGSVVQEQKGQA